VDLTAITPLILTYNEKANIDRTLGRLPWAERVVVVDSYSEDATTDIATSYENVDLVQREFDDHTSQWNYGLEQVDTEWVLSLDADYQVPPAFVEEVQSLDPAERVSGYRASFTYCVHGRPLRGTLYPPRIVLFRTDRARYEQDGHTQRLAVDGPVEDLDALLYHGSTRPVLCCTDGRTPSTTGTGTGIGYASTEPSANWTRPFITMTASPWSGGSTTSAATPGWRPRSWPRPTT